MPLPGGGPAKAVSARAPSAAAALGLPFARVTLPSLVTLLGFLLRARWLGGQSFWWDEAYSAVVARGSLREIVRAIATADFHPPLHYVLLHYWRLVAGESEYALRFTATAAGTATVALGYAAGRRLFGQRGGLASALLFALAPYLVYYSTEARMFALAALFSLLGLYLGHRAAFDGRWWPAFGAAVAVGLWNYYYGVFVLIPVGLLSLATLRVRAVLGYLGAVTLAVALYGPWLPVWLNRTIEWTSPWTGPTSPYELLRWTWPTLLIGIPAAELWRQQYLGALLGAVAFLAAALLLLAPARQRAALLYSCAAVALPLLAMAAVAVYRPIFHPRYAIPAAPGLLLLLGGAITLPSRRLLPLRAALAVVVLALFGYGLYRYQYADGLARDDYRSAVAYVNQNQAPGDVAITNAPPGFDYYYRGSMPRYEFPTGRYEQDAIVRGLNDLAGGRRRLWYVTHDLRPSDPEGFVAGQLQSHAGLIQARRYGHIRVALYALPDPVAFAAPSYHPLPDLAVGDALTLVGYGLDTTPVAAGTDLQLTLHWRVRATPGADYGLWSRLRDPDGFAWGRQDHQPRDADFRLSSSWQPGEQVTTHHAVPVDSGTPPGRYRVEVGAYELGSLTGLDVFAANGVKLGPSFVVGDAEIARNPSPPSEPPVGGATGRVDDAVELAGSGVSQTEARAGTPVELTLLWKASATPGPRERVLRLLGDGGQTVLERRDTPGMGRYPPDRWQPGDLIRDKLRLTIPPTLPDGRYRLWAGLAAPGGEPLGLPVAELKVTGIQRHSDLPPLAHPVDAAFGDGVRLKGWDVARPDPRQVRVTLQWAPTATPSREYRVFNHLVDAAGRIVAQRDGAPVDWSRPTTGWVAGELIDDTYLIELPPDAPTGLKLVVGLYEPTGGARLKTPTGADHLDLGAVPSGRGSG